LLIGFLGSQCTRNPQDHKADIKIDHVLTKLHLCKPFFRLSTDICKFCGGFIKL
jgi:hypothetical protein